LAATKKISGFAARTIFSLLGGQEPAAGVTAGSPLVRVVSLTAPLMRRFAYRAQIVIGI
jgi:hypothetical protein